MAGETVATIIQDIVDTTGAGSDARTQRVLLSSLNLAYDVILTYGAHDFLEQSCTLTLPVNTASLTLPDGSTVLDSDGNTPVRCRNVLLVKLGSTGGFLAPRYRLIDIIKNGELVSLAASTPTHWGTYARRLIIMPPSAAADTVELFYIMGHGALTAATSIIIPDEFRALLIAKTVEIVMSRDGYDERASRLASKNAAEMLANLMHQGYIGTPYGQSQPVLTGEIP